MSQKPSAGMEIDVRRVLDSLADPLLALDRSARIFHANAAMKDLLGWSRRELLGRPVSLVVPGGLPGLPPRSPTAVPAIRRQGIHVPDSRQPFRARATRRDGRSREVEVRLAPWPGGEAEGLSIASFRPLDTQVELERKLLLCRRLHVLDAALTHALSQASSEEEAVHAALRACGETEGWVLGTYWRMDPATGMLTALVPWTKASGLEPFIDTTLLRSFAPPEGLPGQAWTRREPIWSQDVTQDLRFFRADVAAQHGLRGGLFVPAVGSSGQVHGVLELFSREPREDREADEAMGTALGYSVGRFLDWLHHIELDQLRDNTLRRLWDSDLLGLFISDAYGRLLEANPNLLRTLGYSRREVREGRLSWSMLTPPSQRMRMEGILRQLRADGRFHTVDTELLRSDGRGVPTRLGLASLGEGRAAAFALEPYNGQPEEQSLARETDARLHDLVTQAPVVIFAMNRDGIFTLSEGRGLEALGQKPGQLVGMSVFDVYRSEPAVIGYSRRALAGEEFFSVATLASGLIYETRWVPLRDPEGRLVGTLGLAVDVTQREREASWRAQLFADAEAARAEAERAVRVRDEFLTVASHELKTPLTSLNLQLHALMRRAAAGGRAEDAETAHRLDKAQRQLQKLARLMDELLDVSRLTEGRLQLELDEVDLVPLVRDVLERFQEEAGKTRTRLELRSEEQVVGRWDASRLEQVVTNLVSNALKYGSGAPVDIDVRSSGALALLDVTDHGIGIAPEDLERIFEKFERAAPVRKFSGFGLGLYIVRQWVEALGGVVDVESTPGQGTTFHIVLPLAGPEPLAAPSHLAPAPVH